MTTNNVTWQLATPHQHRTNSAERAIHTFKNHLIAGLATVHPEFPILEWDRLIEQAEITLNLLQMRESIQNYHHMPTYLGPTILTNAPWLHQEH